MFQLSRTVKRPIAMFVDRSDRASIEAAVEAGVFAYVVDGLKQERVKPILDMAISRFNAFSSRLTHELEEARSELENRKLIERAKGHPDEVERATTGMPSSIHATSCCSSSSRSVAAGMRLTPNGFEVRRRTASTSRRIRLGGSRTMPRNPKPPASVTAATSSDRATPPMPASTTGCSQPSKSQACVRKDMLTGGLAAVELLQVAEIGRLSAPHPAIACS
jgi:hypothetical protein